MYNETIVLKEHIQLTDKLFIARFESSQLYKDIKPGQFIHMLIPGMPDHPLRRPFSVYKVHESEKTFDILYQVVGEGTLHFSRILPSDSSACEFEAIGPLGNTWTLPDPGSRALIVAGGVGAAPLLMHAEALSNRGYAVDAVLGAQRACDLVAFDDYASLDGAEVFCATDDGSKGHKGFCTIPAAELIAARSYDYCACCGPEPLMRAIASMAKEAGIYCEVSLEKRMGCGIGVCLTCVIDTAQGKKRSCADGPIFDVRELLWT